MRGRRRRRLPGRASSTAGGAGSPTSSSCRPDGSYEVVDTKLARHAKPAHILQLCFYSEQVARIQGREPERMHVVLGSGERESFRLADFVAYYRRVRERFLAAVAALAAETYPYPVAHCELCDFPSVCERAGERRRPPRPSSPACAATRSQRLDGAGITTLPSARRARRRDATSPKIAAGDVRDAARARPRSSSTSAAPASTAYELLAAAGAARLRAAAAAVRRATSSSTSRATRSTSRRRARVPVRRRHRDDGRAALPRRSGRTTAREEKRRVRGVRRLR